MAFKTNSILRLLLVILQSFFILFISIPVILLFIIFLWYQASSLPYFLNPVSWFLAILSIKLGLYESQDSLIDENKDTGFWN